MIFISGQDLDFVKKKKKTQQLIALAINQSQSTCKKDMGTTISF